MEDLLIKVRKFIFPVDFMILDIEENEVTPIILGKLFLNTIGTLIDVKEGKLTWWLGDEEEVFKVFGTATNSFSPHSCNFVQATNKIKVIFSSNTHKP